MVMHGRMDNHECAWIVEKGKVEEMKEIVEDVFDRFELK